MPDGVIRIKFHSFPAYRHSFLVSPRSIEDQSKKRTAVHRHRGEFARPSSFLDGNGNISSNSTLIVGGTVIFQNLIVPNGTYTVKKDCTGTLTLGASGVVLDIFVVPNGEAYDYVQTAPSGNILSGTISRVSGGTEDEQ